MTSPPVSSVKRTALIALLILAQGCASQPRTARVVTALAIGSVAVTALAHSKHGADVMRVSTPTPPDCTARPTVCQ